MQIQITVADKNSQNRKKKVPSQKLAAIAFLTHLSFNELLPLYYYYTLLYS